MAINGVVTVFYVSMFRFCFELSLASSEGGAREKMRKILQMIMIRNYLAPKILLFFRVFCIEKSSQIMEVLMFESRLYCDNLWVRKNV